ncbi:MAG: hypothetical protein LC687_07320 [Actinobacteria bacterium]|nr:hypothetical protein [Actinomycetota bacterium]
MTPCHYEANTMQTNSNRLAMSTAELRAVLKILADYRDAPLNKATVDLALRLARVTHLEAAR